MSLSIDTILHPARASELELKQLDAQIAYIDVLLANLAAARRASNQPAERAKPVAGGAA